MDSKSDQVHTRDVSISTIQVTIKTLTVSGRQMTIALFKQIPEVPIYLPDGTIYDGRELWGLVKHDNREWVVYTFDDRLCKWDIDKVAADWGDHIAEYSKLKRGVDEWYEWKANLEEKIQVEKSQGNLRQEGMYKDDLKRHLEQNQVSVVNTAGDRYIYEQLDKAILQLEKYDELWAISQTSKQSAKLLRSIPQLYIAC